MSDADPRGRAGGAAALAIKLVRRGLDLRRGPTLGLGDGDKLRGSRINKAWARRLTSSDDNVSNF